MKAIKLPRAFSLLMVFSLITNLLWAQTTATSASQRTESYQQRVDNNNSIAAGIEMTNIGPTIMSGRVVDLAVNEAEPHNYYVAYASGGLWFTNNYGSTFEPLFDYESVMTIGDIAVDWKNNMSSNIMIKIEG